MSFVPAGRASIGDSTCAIDLWFDVASFCADSDADGPILPEKRSLNSLMFANRCSLSFASARMIALRIDSGSAAPFGVASMAFGAAVMWRVAHSQAVFASNGSVAVSISYAITASE